MEILSEQIRKSNKTHICSLCGGEIIKQECYVIQNIKDGGNIYTSKMHYHCQKLISELNMDCNYEGISDNDFCMHLENYLNEEIPIWYKAKIISEFVRIYK